MDDATICLLCYLPLKSTTSGVRQGCVLAPDLFCRAIDWLMSRVKPGGNLGIRVGQNTFDDLDYADECSPLTEH